MTHWALINLVTDMRRAQKEYFRTRSKEALLKAKKLEDEVDKEISKWENECKTAVEELMLF
jgi:phosphate uptake regulator